jgi:hypothetical protein
LPIERPPERQHWGGMPKRKEPELTPAEQYKRFKEAAKKAELTKDEKDFGLRGCVQRNCPH